MYTQYRQRERRGGVARPHSRSRTQNSLNGRAALVVSAERSCSRRAYARPLIDCLLEALAANVSVAPIPEWLPTTFCRSRGCTPDSTRMMRLVAPIAERLRAASLKSSTADAGRRWAPSSAGGFLGPTVLPAIRSRTSSQRDAYVLTNAANWSGPVIRVRLSTANCSPPASRPVRRGSDLAAARRPSRHTYDQTVAQTRSLSNACPDGRQFLGQPDRSAASSPSASSARRSQSRASRSELRHRTATIKKSAPVGTSNPTAAPMKPGLERATASPRDPMAKHQSNVDNRSSRTLKKMSRRSLQLTASNATATPRHSARFDAEYRWCCKEPNDTPCQRRSQRPICSGFEQSDPTDTRTSIRNKCGGPILDSEGPRHPASTSPAAVRVVSFRVAKPRSSRRRSRA